MKQIIPLASVIGTLASIILSTYGWVDLFKPNAISGYIICGVIVVISFALLLSTRAIWHNEMEFVSIYKGLSILAAFVVIASLVNAVHRGVAITSEASSSVVAAIKLVMAYAVVMVTFLSPISVSFHYFRGKRR